MSELKEKTAKGMGWGFADNLVGSGITAVVSIVLARLLSTSDFGMIGMITIFISFAVSFMDSGFSGALTRKKDASAADFNTVFYTNLFLSIVVYLILFFCAPLIAGFFGIPLLRDLVRVLSFSVVILAFSQVQKVLLIRKLDFKSQAIISLAASLLSGVVGIVMAVCGCGVWSLVAQQLTRFGVSSLLMWVFSSWKPSLAFSVSSFKEMFDFGSKLLATSFISIVWNEVYSVIIGKIYSPSLVGLYSRADKFKSMVTSNVAIVVQRVSYPVLSGIQDQKERQVRVYAKVLKTTALVSCTLVLGLLACSEPLVMVLIGEKWLPSVPFLKILCVSGVFLPLTIISVNVLNANGKSDMTLLLEVIKTLLAVIPVLLGIYYSIEALLWGAAAVSLISYVIHAFFVSKVLNYSVVKQFRDVFPYILFSALMCGAVWCVGLLVDIMWLKLLVQLLVGFAVVVLIYEFVYKSEEYAEVRDEILKCLHVKKSK